MSKTTTATCPRCGRSVEHRTARQKEVCIETLSRWLDKFDIDGPHDPKRMVSSWVTEGMTALWRVYKAGVRSENGLARRLLRSKLTR